jgi:hypothetical protein
MKLMRVSSIAVLLAWVLVSPLVAEREAGPRVAVLAELFTSEGCSSCPPADALIAKLIETQPFDGIEIVALAHHVDYWDGLGWQDPFSSATASRRQEWYAGAFGSDRIYTPQMIVDGQREFVGGDTGLARRAIQAAAKRPKTEIRLRRDADTDGDCTLAVRVDRAPGDAKGEPVEVVVAVTEDGLSARVLRGENRGRTLTHDGVVRSLDTVGALVSPAAFDRSVTLRLAPEWNRARLRAVVFLQGQRSRRVYGVQKLSLK